MVEVPYGGIRMLSTMVLFFLDHTTPSHQAVELQILGQSVALAVLNLGVYSYVAVS